MPDAVEFIGQAVEQEADNEKLDSRLIAGLASAFLSGRLFAGSTVV